MRIAYLLADPGIGIFGTKGASVHAQEMIRAFRSLGHDVTVFCTKRGDRFGDPASESRPDDLADLRVHVIPVAGAKGAAAREIAVARASSAMAALAGDGEFDLLYERYSLFSTAGAQVKRSRACQLVVEVNAPLLAEQARHRTLHDVDGAAIATRETFSQADLLSCVSSPIAEWARTMSGTSTQPPGVRVTANGVDPARFRHSSSVLTRSRQSDLETVTIGFLGTLKPWHGTDLLINAFARALQQLAPSPGVPAATGARSGRGGPQTTKLKLLIVGGGPERRALEELTAELGITEVVEFTGPVAPEHVPAALRRFDIAAAPYPAPPAGTPHYFSPLKVYEYLAAGVPILASAVGELPELLAGSASTGPAGEAVPAGDVDALTASLISLIQDPAQRARLGAAGRLKVETEHTWVQRAADLLQDLARLNPETGARGVSRAEVSQV
ncbi:glycosyltransferase family 4 protein [Nesterenkonia halotolerans]|uniref:Glycosyltransferase involved in cell wall biosynthesis n=1 Tax=Nesterenkonia halotolerans TaxID=225325 RepID=A0ABR9J5G2_9MICC|nr:glycosyltransferase family 4 protein [Nesterenkonia halotolerans]MBE1514228.1 glycosyltransferase involved in cell wall biosynthesis [Nesterenkonia halotolerans]